MHFVLINYSVQSGDAGMACIMEFGILETKHFCKKCDVECSS